MKIKFQFSFMYRGWQGEKQETETVSLTDLKRLVRAIQSPNFTHSRYRNFCGGMVSVYQRDSSSPSGVLCAAGGREELVEFLLKRYGRTSSLSPTEGLVR